jgi:diphthamide biosynthesis methyltransferase
MYVEIKQNRKTDKHTLLDIEVKISKSIYRENISQHQY